MVNIIEKLREGVQDDLSEAYKNITREGTLGDVEFYEFVFSSNPKPYPISGLQHFLGSGFIAARVASFLGLDEYNVIVAFLSGLFHDLHKVSEKSYEKDLIFEKLQKTSLYNTGIRGALDEKKARNAIVDALEVASKLWSGGVPRRLQCLADMVAVADVLTGSEKNWSLSQAMSTLVEGVLDRKPLCTSWIKEENLLPVYMGRQRPLVALVSERIEEELEKLGALPLVSTPEGMLLLVKDSIDVLSIYEKLSSSIMHAMGEEAGEEQSREKEIDVSRIKDFIDGNRSLPTYSKTYVSIAGYSTKTIEKTFEKASLVDEDLRLFVVVLAYIYSKDPNKKEKDVARVKRYLDSLGIYSITGRTVGEILVNLYKYLRNTHPNELRKIAEKAKDFVIDEMRKFHSVDPSLLINKLNTYVSIGVVGNQGAGRPDKGGGGSIKKCAICRDPVIIEKSLSSYLQVLKNEALKGVNISELFHPDLQGRPEKVGSIEETGKLTVCETCYFEAISYRRLGHTDGLWARVLVYYPAMSIDLMKAVKGAIEAVTGHKVRVLNDYMTAKIIIPTGSTVLARHHLEEAAAFWYVFGGNLVVTTTAISSAFAWKGLPVELEVSDVIVEEAVAKYMEILGNIEKYAWFTEKIRYWLYNLLITYFTRLEDRKGGNTSLRFSRSLASVTGYPSIDVFSLLLKQS